MAGGEVAGIFKAIEITIPLVTRILGMKRENDDVYRDVRKEGRIFLSYRSSSIGDVAELARNVYRSHGKTCRYFPPGVLSREAMSRMRRWNVLSLLDLFPPQRKSGAASATHTSFLGGLMESLSRRHIERKGASMATRLCGNRPRRGPRGSGLFRGRDHSGIVWKLPR